MMTQELFQMALNITNPWTVTDIQFNTEDKKLDIYVDFIKGSTFSYEYIDYKTETKKVTIDGKESEIKNKIEISRETFNDLKAYDTMNKKWRHLNFFEHECYIHARVPRVKLPNEKVKLIKTPWEGISNGFTLLFEALLMQLCLAMPVNKVASLVRVSDDKLWTMIDRYVTKTRVHENFENIQSIGLDETSRAKGHDYITLFVDLEKRRTIFITQGKDNTTVDRFKEDLEAHNGKADNIKEVSVDMSPAFKKGIDNNFPDACIVYDKFHIIKHLNDAVNKVRISEAIEEKVLKGTRYVFLKNEDNLTNSQKELLKECTMSNMNLKTVRAYNIRKAFQNIYQADTEEKFITYLNKWYFWATHSRLEPVKEVAYMIKNHWDGIVSWYTNRINNGILEGLNSVIQAAKSKARGYKTFKNYKNIVYLLTGKLDFNLVNVKFREI